MEIPGIVWIYAGSIVLIISFMTLTTLAIGKRYGVFEPRPLLTDEGKTLLGILDTAVPVVFGPQTRIMLNISYGRFLKAHKKQSALKIEQRRADYLIVDENLEALCVIEYHGPAHFGKGAKGRDYAEARDRMKRRACESAGIPLVEIPTPIVKEDVVARLQEARNHINQT